MLLVSNRKFTPAFGNLWDFFFMVNHIIVKFLNHMLRVRLWLPAIQLFSNDLCVASQEGRTDSTSPRCPPAQRWRPTWKWPQRSCTPWTPKASRVRPDACCVTPTCACTRVRQWACTNRFLSPGTQTPLPPSHTYPPLPRQEISRKTKKTQTEAYTLRRAAACQQGCCPEFTLRAPPLLNACLSLERLRGVWGGGRYLHCALVEVLCSSCSSM